MVSAAAPAHRSLPKHALTSHRAAVRSGVNAKRYNWFSNTLAAKPGWTSTPILSKGHEEYFSLNGVTDKDVVNASPDAAVKPAGKVKLEGSGKFGTVGV